MARLTRREFMQGLAGAGLLCAGCFPRPRRPQNVVCVLIDQLRKDYSDRYLTELNELARRGIVFEDMRSAAPWTYPSVVTLLSGLYPQQHGADGHPRENKLSHFDPEVPLLQKRLQAEGFTTLAFITNPYLLGWNAFHLGFDTFDSQYAASQGDRAGGESWIPERMFADSVNTGIRARFDMLPRRGPEFTYIHYIDVHGPWKGAPFPRNYREAIRFVDAKVAEIYRYFMQRYDGDLLFFVTSDHGRALDDDLSVGEGPEWRKQKHSVHDFNLRIPFMVLPSDFVREPRHIAGPCSNVDFVPTVLDWLGLPESTPSPGVSLLPAIRDGAPLPRSRPIYSRNSAFGPVTDAVVLSGRKYMRYFDPSGRKLLARRVFDLERDPRETTSIEGEFGAAAEMVDTAAGTHGLSFEAEFRGLSAETEAQLRALGYLGE